MEAKANELVAEFVQFAAQSAEPTSLQADKLRWQIANDRFPPAVVILRRGKRQPGITNVVAVISNAGKFASLYPSWQPVIKDWISKRVANAGKRTNHNEFAGGDMPQKGLPT